MVGGLGPGLLGFGVGLWSWSSGFGLGFRPIGGLLHCYTDTLLSLKRTRDDQDPGQNGAKTFSRTSCWRALFACMHHSIQIDIQYLDLCTHTHIHSYLHHGCIHTSAHPYVHTYLHRHIHKHVYIAYKLTYIHACMHKQLHTCTCGYTHT